MAQATTAEKQAQRDAFVKYAINVGGNVWVSDDGKQKRVYFNYVFVEGFGTAVTKDLCTSFYLDVMNWGFKNKDGSDAQEIGKAYFAQLAAKTK